MDVNHVVLIGRLTRDPELSYLQSGTALAKFSLAVNRSFKRGDERVEEVDFFDVTVWSKTAENCSNYLKKGSQVCVMGQLRQNRWQDQDGKKRSKISINGAEIVS